MTSLQVRVFGKLRLKHRETVVAVFPTRRVEELLGYLLLNQGSELLREKLVDTLWPDASLSNGRASLSTALWRLRNVFNQLDILPQDYLSTTREWVRFSPPESMELDLTTFHNHLVTATQDSESPSAEQALKAAVSVYKGSFCEGIYAEWCLLERERLEREYLRALGQLMAAQMQRQAYNLAATLGEEILMRDPLREEVHRALMHCYWKLDRRSSAIRQFQRCARLLQSELQILPMPETISLYRRIIDERLYQLQQNGHGPTPSSAEILAAYNNFLLAAEDLNLLLDEVKEGSKEPVAVT
jgi:DNA-binding SARP family transcriptional activator